MIRDALSDARLALRQFARRPGFTFLAVATLALGVGATVALFSVVRGLLLRPLPLRARGTAPGVLRAVRLDWCRVRLRRERIKAFESLATYSTDGVTLTTEAGSALLLSNVVSANLFDVLGVRPMLGRTFKEGEDRPGSEPVVVLGWGTWKQEFGGDPNILGKRIVLAGVTNTVIGVMPRGFYFPSPDVRIWQPLNLDPASSIYNNNGWLVLMGRARGGMSAAQLNDEVQSIARDLGQRFTYPDAWDRSKNASITPLRESMLGNVKPALLLLLGAGHGAPAHGVRQRRRPDPRAHHRSHLRNRPSHRARRGERPPGPSDPGRVGDPFAGCRRGGRGTRSRPVQDAGREPSAPERLRRRRDHGLDHLRRRLRLALLVGLAVSAIPIRHLLLGRLSGVSGERATPIAKGGAGRAHAVLVTAEVTLAVLLRGGRDAPGAVP
jgi:hypothetical protein